MESHIIAVKKLLGDKFKFLKRLNSPTGYLLSGARNQQIIRKQISEYFSWNRVY